MASAHLKEGVPVSHPGVLLPVELGRAGESMKEREWYARWAIVG